MIFAAGVCFIVGHTCDVSEGSVDTGMVNNFVYGPEVTATKKFVPFFCYSFPVVEACNSSINKVNSFFIIVVKLQQPVDILSTDTGHSQLSVFYAVAFALQPICKLVGVCIFCIVRNAGVVVITFHTITVGHGVAKRNVVKLLVAFSKHYEIQSGAAYAKYHAQCHDKRSSFFEHFHLFCSF